MGRYRREKSLYPRNSLGQRFISRWQPASAAAAALQNKPGQAGDYAANQGCEWVVLTSGARWQVYRIFAKPIDRELVLDLNICDLNTRSDHDVAQAWLMAKQGWQKDHITEYHQQKQALSRFSVGAVITSDGILEVIRRALRKVLPGIRIELEDSKGVIENEVIKREVLEGEKASEARRAVSRALNKSTRQKTARPVTAEGTGEFPALASPIEEVASKGAEQIAIVPLPDDGLLNSTETE